MKLFLFVTLSLTLFIMISSLPSLKINQEDSSISTIVIPYAPYTTDLIENSRGKLQKVFVHLKKDIVPRISLQEGEIAMGSRKRAPVNFAVGAYPVYYMPGHVNGKFQDKTIHVLE